MAKNIKGCYPLSVKEIVFEDGSTMENKEILLVGDFVVIDRGDDPPSMYNVRTVSELHGVQEIRPQTKNVVW